MLQPLTPADRITGIFLGVVALGCIGAVVYLLVRAWWGA